MLCSVFLVCCALQQGQVLAVGLLGGSIVPQASLDVFKTSSKGGLVPQLPGVSNQQRPPGSQPVCTGTAALLNGNCKPNSNVIQGASETLDTLNVNGKVDVPLTPLEAEGNLSLNPTKINASANLNNKNERNNTAVPENFSSPPSAPGNEGSTPNRMKPSGNQVHCLETVTEVNGKPSCKGKLVFEENFDILDHNKWQHRVQFSGAPDYDFVVYSNDKKNSYVSNGKLHVKPTLLLDDGIDVTSSTLDLEGCTGTPQTPECRKTAIGRDILPPMKSARLRTMESFSFRYGHVEVQAKLPAGDWIFPEIWLEPKKNAYGSNRYESGLIQIALSRGNRNLILGDKEIGGRLLTASCIQGIAEVVHNETFSTNSIGLWSNDFHTYTMTWTPDNITFRVDGKVIGTTPPADGFAKLGPFSDLQVPWIRGSKIAPYDQEFFLSIGVGAGGFRVFPDDSVSSGHGKPWKNFSLKAMLSFWQDKDSWFPSWLGDTSTLQIEHIKVWAL